jgi:hypothetical protein
MTIDNSYGTSINFVHNKLQVGRRVVPSRRQQLPPFVIHFRHAAVAFYRMRVCIAEKSTISKVPIDLQCQK